jgi:predicted nucleic acid-binding protein
MIVVLDASAAVHAQLSIGSHAEIRTVIAQADRVVTSDLFGVEVANAVWKYARAGVFDAAAATQLLHAAADLPTEVVPIRANIVEALHEGIRLGRPIYDMIYFTLARDLGAKLLTADKKLARLAAENGVKSALRL